MNEDLPIACGTAMPIGWAEIRLGEICEIYQPETISKKELIENGKYLVYGANGVIGRYDKYNHEHSELLITCRGATCGSVNMSLPRSWINGNAMVIRPRFDFIGREFLRYFFRGYIDFSSVITGSAQPQITRQSLSPVLVPLPPPNEQRRIVEKLDRIFDRLRKVRDELSHIKKLIDRYRQSVLTAAFRGDLTADFRADLIQQKTTNDLSMSNNLPISWTIAEIRAVVEKYQTIDPKKFPENSFTYVDIGSIDNRTQVITEPKTFLGKDAPSRARRIIKYEDTLFSTVRTYLKNIALVPKELDGCLTSTGICILRPSDQVNPLYLFNWVRSDQFVKSMSVVMDGTMYPAVNDSDVYSGKIPLPPLEEQKEIVRRIEERFAKIEKIEQEYQKAVKLCDRLEQETLAKAFRGELVPQDPNDEPASVLLERIRSEKKTLTQPKGKSRRQK